MSFWNSFWGGRQLHLCLHLGLLALPSPDHSIIFWIPNRSHFGILFEEGENYVLANTSAHLLFLLIIILSFFAFLTEVILEFFLRRATTTSSLTPGLLALPSQHHSIIFCFPNKSLFGILFEEGDNYVLANTSAYLLFLLIIILSFFWFSNKSLFGNIFWGGRQLRLGYHLGLLALPSHHHSINFFLVS